MGHPQPIRIVIIKKCLELPRIYATQLCIKDLLWTVHKCWEDSAGCLYLLVKYNAFLLKVNSASGFTRQVVFLNRCCLWHVYLYLKQGVLEPIGYIHFPVLKGQMHHHDDLGSKCAYTCHLSNKTNRKSVLLSTPQIWLIEVSKKLAWVWV